MTFSEAYALHGPDTLAISEALGIPEHEADRLINERMEQKARNRAHQSRLRSELREIRARRPA